MIFQKLRNFIIQIVNVEIQNFQFSIDASGLISSLGFFDVNNENNDNDDNKWNVIDFGFFDSHFDKSYKKDEIVIVEKDMYYRNLIFFVKRIRDFVIIKKTIFVRNNLNIVLKNSILIWYIIEFSNLERVKLRINENEIEK